MTETIQTAMDRLMTISAEPQDYIAGDGLLYCGTCNTPKEAFFPNGRKLFGRDRHPAECQCRQATMKEKIYDARTGMEYILIGDYYLPALKVPRTRPVGRWGMLHKAYLKLRKPAYYQSLLLNGKLDAVLADVEEQAAERYEVLIEQMSQRESISEKLKEENQMEWVRRMRNLENRAEEIVKAELIYTFERR